MTSFYGGGSASVSSAKGALIFKGTLGISDDGATVLALPDTHKEGWTYLVVTAGTYAGQLCEKGDFVICVSSGKSASDLDWTVVQGNTFSTLPTPTALDEGKIIAVGADGNYALINNPADSCLPLAGGTMTGSIDAGKNTVTNLKEPEEGTDATTKSYVDDKVAKAAPVSMMPISEVEGQNLITVNDSVEWPLQGLKVYGKSTQDGTPSPESPVPIVIAGDDGSIDLTVSNSTDQSQSLTLSTPTGLPGVPVDSGGNYTDEEGQQWICSYVNFAKQKYFNVAQKIVLHTDANWFFESLSGRVGYTGLRNIIKSPETNGRIATLVCDHYKTVSANSTYNKNTGISVQSGEPSAGTIYIYDPKFTSMDEFKNWLNDNTLTIVYELATITETDIPTEELAAYRALHTYDGSTVVSTNEDIAGLKVKYVAKAIDYQQSINAAIQETNDKIDAVYNSLVKKAETVDEVNQLFKDWWNANWEEGSSTYNDMLERWFGKVLDDDKVYGVKLPLFETSTSPQGEYIEDSVGLTITNSTDQDVGQNDFAKTPQFWCVEVAAEKNADGSHTIYACEFIDDINVVRNGGPDNGKHLVWVLQKNTYVHEYEESGYSYIKIQCHPADGFVQWPQGTDRTGRTYSYIANPKYAAGIDDEENIGCRTGLKPTCYMSMNKTIQAWRARGPQYSGSSACFYKWAYIMFALLTAKKGENVGCNNYNYQYAAAVSESGVSRIILTANQANNLYVGSNVIIGNTEGNNDRGQAAMYGLVKLRKISSIEEVTIEEDASSYKAVYIDVPEGTTFDTTAGTTYISTMPFYSGWTDTVKGTIGTKYGTNLNRQPFLLQKVELMNGAYNYASDELDEWSQQDDTHYLYNYYLCEDQTKVSTNGTITDDYVKKENATITIDTSVYTTNNSWYYIEDNLADNNFKMLNPKKISTSAGSGTGTRDAFHLKYAASGVITPIVWASLQSSELAGLSCRDSTSNPSWIYWGYTGGCPGLSG